jgi:hypothetical protein
MKRLVIIWIAALMTTTVLVDHAAARKRVHRPRIVITAKPPFYYGLGPGGYWGPGPAWYRETHPALFCWYGPCWWGRPGG